MPSRVLRLYASVGSHVGKVGVAIAQFRVCCLRRNRGWLLPPHRSCTLVALEVEESGLLGISGSATGITDFSEADVILPAIIMKLCSFNIGEMWRPLLSVLGLRKGSESKRYGI